MSQMCGFMYLHAPCTTKYKYSSIIQVHIAKYFTKLPRIASIYFNSEKINFFTKTCIFVWLFPSRSRFSSSFACNTPGNRNLEKNGAQNTVILPSILPILDNQRAIKCFMNTEQSAWIILVHFIYCCSNITSIPVTLRFYVHT